MNEKRLTASAKISHIRFFICSGNTLKMSKLDYLCASGENEIGKTHYKSREIEVNKQSRKIIRTYE